MTIHIWKALWTSSGRRCNTQVYYSRILERRKHSFVARRCILLACKHCLGFNSVHDNFFQFKIIVKVNQRSWKELAKGAEVIKLMKTRRGFCLCSMFRSQYLCPVSSYISLERHGVCMNSWLMTNVNFTQSSNKNCHFYCYWNGTKWVHENNARTKKSLKYVKAGTLQNDAKEKRQFLLNFDYIDVN